MNANGVQGLLSSIYFTRSGKLTLQQPSADLSHNMSFQSIFDIKS